MTPLFAATLASQTGMTQQGGEAAAEVGGVRATQQVGLAFTPTQGKTLCACVWGGGGRGVGKQQQRQQKGLKAVTAMQL